jgi:hypothetical protein
MTEPIAGTFVEPRGMIRSIVAGVAGGEVAGAIGAAATASIAAATTAGASPLAPGQIAYLAAFADEVVMFRAKRGALRPKQTTEVLAAAPRGDLRAARLDKGRLAGVLTLDFADGTAWAFDVPKVHLAGAAAIAAVLA